jgi:hypothetical protein
MVVQQQLHIAPVHPALQLALQRLLANELLLWKEKERKLC